RKAALLAYQDALRISQPLAEAAPQNVQAQTDLFFNYWKLGGIEKTQFEYARATEWFGRGRRVLQLLEQAGKLVDPYKSAPAIVDREIAFCQAAERAVEDLDFALRQPADQGPALLSAPAGALAREAKTAQAVATADQLVQLEPKKADNLYGAACGYALCAAAAEDRELRETYSLRAMELLRQAVEAGYKDLNNIKQDPNLA